MTTRASSMLALCFFLSLGAFARAQVAGTWVMTGMPRDGGLWLHDEYTQDVNGTTQDGKGWGTWKDPSTGTTMTNYTASINITEAACATDATTNETTYRAKYSWTQAFYVGSYPLPTLSGSYKVWCAYHSYDSKAKIMTMEIWHEPASLYGALWEPGACPATKEEAANGISWMQSDRQTETFTYRCVAGCQPWSWQSWSCDNKTTVVVSSNTATRVGSGIGLICTFGFAMLTFSSTFSSFN